ncbi:E3 ubiquitin-protein ligase CCNP1IP1 [Dendrobium catenatum]|uniref:E3 ubiquitin-protein ligase CCNP1IP1 n=1 Tax=Dendrobium catenatum TaxID=906689 RepID=A0A2I0W0H8_9ASPA|nr:E3 ubiquitin-protein ligase CCNP1IP1 [Dendrobium catenatum]
MPAEIRDHTRKVHRKDGAAYQKMTKRCQILEQENEILTKDKQELQEKYAEKSRASSSARPTFGVGINNPAATLPNLIISSMKRPQLCRNRSNLFTYEAKFSNIYNIVILDFRTGESILHDNLLPFSQNRNGKLFFDNNPPSLMIKVRGKLDIEQSRLKVEVRSGRRCGFGLNFAPIEVEIEDGEFSLDENLCLFVSLSLDEEASTTFFRGAFGLGYCWRFKRELAALEVENGLRSGWERSEVKSHMDIANFELIDVHFIGEIKKDWMQDYNDSLYHRARVLKVRGLRYKAHPAQIEWQIWRFQIYDVELSRLYSTIIKDELWYYELVQFIKDRIFSGRPPPPHERRKIKLFTNPVRRRNALQKLLNPPPVE